MPEQASSAPFTHSPRPAEIPETHPNQRYFVNGRGPLARDTDIGEQYSRTGFRVYRNAVSPLAELRVRVVSPYGRAEASIDMQPGELRDLAQRLLDAAHDIEAFPAPCNSAAVPS